MEITRGKGAPSLTGFLARSRRTALPPLHFLGLVLGLFTAALSPVEASNMSAELVLRSGVELDTNPERLSGVSAPNFAARGAAQGRTVLRLQSTMVHYQGLVMGKAFPRGPGVDTLTLDHALRVSHWLGAVVPSMSLRHVERVEPSGPDRFRLLQPRVGVQSRVGVLDLGARAQWSELLWFADRRLDARGPDMGMNVGVLPSEWVRLSYDVDHAWRTVDEVHGEGDRRQDRLLTMSLAMEWRPSLHVFDARVERAWQHSTVAERAYQRWSLGGGWTTALGDRWFFRTAATIRWLSYQEALLVEEGLFVEDENRSTVHAALSGPTPWPALDWELRHASSFRISDHDTLGPWTRHQVGVLLVWRPGRGQEAAP